MSGGTTFGTSKTKQLIEGEWGLLAVKCDAGHFVNEAIQHLYDQLPAVFLKTREYLGVDFIDCASIGVGSSGGEYLQGNNGTVHRYTWEVKTR